MELHLECNIFLFRPVCVRIYTDAILQILPLTNAALIPLTTCTEHQSQEITSFREMGSA